MDVILLIACITAGLVIFGPAILFLWTRSIVKYSPYPYCFSLVSSGLWIVYGARHRLNPVYYVNCAAALANALYTALFLCYCARADHRRRYLNCFLLAGAVVFGIIFLVDVAGSHDVYDGLCSSVSVLVSLAPFINMLAVPRGRTREAMPAFPVPSLALANAISWTLRNTVGVRLHDINLHLLIPSSAAAICAFVLLVLQCIFWMQGPPQPLTGVLRPLISQTEREEAEGSGRGGELRLNVDGNGEITTIKDNDVKIATSQEVRNNAPPHGGELRLDDDGRTDNGEITILKDDHIRVATGREVNNDAPLHDQAVPARTHIETTKLAEEERPGRIVVENTLAATSTKDKVELETVLSHVPVIPARTDIETARLAEEERAGQVVVDNTPAATSTKDNDEPETALPHGDAQAS